MELAQARADQQRLVVLQDRERIARDLHDHVIQRVFGAGLALEGIAGSVEPAVALRLVAVVEDLDVTIRQIRDLIFRLQLPEAGRTLRSAVLDVAGEAAAVLGFAPDVSFIGPVDTATGDALVDDVVAVTREALSNVVRHAHASHAAMTVSAVAGELTVLVSDDGVGLGDITRRSGLDNLTRRALRHGGTSELGSCRTGGTELRWTVPLA
jgi:signal transduction histidine kinase